MRRNSHTTLPHTWGRQIYRYRKAIVVTWLLLFCVLLPFAFKRRPFCKDNGFTPKDSPAQIGIEKLEEGLGLSAASLDIVVVSQHDENLTAGTAQRRILTELEPLRAHPYVRDIYMNMATHKAGQDHIVSVTVLLDLDSTEALKQFEEIRDSVPGITGADTYITGNTAIFADMNQAVKSDIIHAEMIGIPAALILAVVFGTLTAAILPLLAGVASVVVTMGILYFVALADGSISNFLPNVVTMLPGRGHRLCVAGRKPIQRRDADKERRCGHCPGCHLRNRRQSGDVLRGDRADRFCGDEFHRSADLPFLQHRRHYRGAVISAGR